MAPSPHHIAKTVDDPRCELLGRDGVPARSPHSCPPSLPPTATHALKVTYRVVDDLLDVKHVLFTPSVSGAIPADAVGPVACALYVLGSDPQVVHPALQVDELGRFIHVDAAVLALDKRRQNRRVVDKRQDVGATDAATLRHREEYSKFNLVGLPCQRALAHVAETCNTTACAPMGEQWPISGFFGSAASPSVAVMRSGLQWRPVLMRLGKGDARSVSTKAKAVRKALLRPLSEYSRWISGAHVSSANLFPGTLTSPLELTPKLAGLRRGHACDVVRNELPDLRDTTLPPSPPQCVSDAEESACSR